jgi:TatD DNase family protein
MENFNFKFVDTHCHVHFSAYVDDRFEVLARARAAGVAMITIGTLQKTSIEAVAFAHEHPDVWAAIGLHPNNIHAIHASEDEGDGYENFNYEFYKKLGADSRVVAIGETGMDLFRIPEQFDRATVIADQEKVFRAHLDLCDELQKPVVIHCRDAHEPVTKILHEYISAGRLVRRGVLHCFTGTAEQAITYTKLGMYISVPGIITFPPKKNEPENALAAAVRVVPRDQLLIETDCPYLTPVPHRGERNEPSYVVHTAEAIAQIWETTCEEVAAQTTRNARTLFHI